MRICADCPNRKHLLKCLECQQKAEQKHKIVLPEIIEPVKKVSLDQLSDREKACLVLKIVAEMTEHRIANIFGISHHTVKSAIAKAFKKVKRQKKP